MRIRNSRPTFSQLNPPETTPRAAHLRSEQGSQYNCFAVEEENRRIGWSFCQINRFPAQVSRENQSHNQCETGSSTGVRPLNCTNPASEGKIRCTVDERKKISSSAGSPGNILAEVKEECATGEVEEEVATIMVKVEDAIVEDGNAKVGVKEDIMVAELKMETTEMNELEHFNEDDDFQTTRSSNCTVTCGSCVPYVTIDENQHQKQERGLEETAFETNEKPRRGRKRNRSGLSATPDVALQGRERQSRGRPNAMQDHSVEGNPGCIGQPRRGRPKIGTEGSVDPNNRIAETSKPKRGRPKRVKEQQNSQLM